MKSTTIPFIEYRYEDKSKYPLSSTKGYIDPDDDFLIGDSGGFLMNMNFSFINTSEFSEVANYFTLNKCYTKAIKGTKEYKEFWKRETKRRVSGLTLNCKLLDSDKDEYYNPNTTEQRKKELLKPLRITGDHYNYLNYGRIMRTKNKQEIEQFGNKPKTIKGFPRFWDGDYWNFKLDEFIYNNGFHIAKGKARRKGYSFKRGSQTANTVNLHRDVTVLLAAYDIKYLTNSGGTSDMVKQNLDWYEDNTYWKRGYLSEPLTNIELGYKKAKEGNKKYGFRSKVISVTLFNNPSAPIGKGAVDIDYEEAGRCPNLRESLGVTLSAAEVGDDNIGVVHVYGTGGVKDADWEGFSDVFYNPNAWGMIPMENIWDHDARMSTCGFFHPQVWDCEPYIDEHGNSLLEEAYEADKKHKELAKKESPTAQYIVFVGQRANSPEEAFKRGGENIFSSPELTIHYQNVLTNNSYKYWRDGMIIETGDGVEFRTNKQLETEGIKTHPFIDEFPFNPKNDLYGCIREYYPPFKIDGVIPDDLYYAVLDPVGKDKDVREITNKNSLNAIYVLMYPNNISNSSGDIIVAEYVGRQTNMEDTSKIAALLCKRYNCKVLPETDRGTTVADFRRMKLLHLLHKDPTGTISEKAKESPYANYGINIGEGSKAIDGLFYLKDWLYTPVSVNGDTGETVYILHYIRSIGLLKELLMYRKNLNCDRISAMRIAMFQRMAYQVKHRKAKTIPTRSLLSEISLYK